LEAFERAWEYRKSLKIRQSNHSQDRNSTDLDAAEISKAQLSKVQLSKVQLSKERSSLTSAPLSTASPRHNLPAGSHTAFIGARTHLVKLLERLAAAHPARIISIEGMGGVGKTTLTLEIAHQCLRASHNPEAFPGVPVFDAIVFTSAKPHHFVGSLLSQRLKVESNLQDILRVIFRALHLLDSMPLLLSQQLELLQESLAHQRTLLIIDNLETLEGSEHILSLLGELPATVKVILTSRVRLGVGTTLSLDCLSVEDGLALIQHYAQEKAVAISPAQAQAIYQQTGGLPLAIAYGVGQVAVYGMFPAQIPAALTQSNSDFMRYCFEESVQRVRGQSAHTLLMALTLFRQSASVEALTWTALMNVDLHSTETHLSQDGLALLHRLSLVEVHSGEYGLHPLTRRYAEAELRMYPSFEQDARSRQVAWYLRLLEPYGQRNWRDWQEFTSLEQEWENLCGLMEWCKANDRYDDFRQLWQQLKGYTQFYGHWHERLDWMDWLTKAATQRQDAATLADALYHTSRTLYLFNQLEQTQQAIDYGQQAWEIAQTQNDWMLQVDLTIHTAALCSQQQQFDQAIDWLNQGETLLQKFARDRQTELHQWVDIDYYRAEIYLEHQDVQRAKQLYTEALKKAEQVGWQRAIVYIKGGLAAVAVMEGNLHEAKHLLDFVLLQASQHNDRRCISFCQNHLALLEKARGNLLAAQEWAQSAKYGFERLKMQDKAIEMDSLLDENRIQFIHCCRIYCEIYF
jgi:LuxR family glucitol operon transcriptional activator